MLLWVIARGPGPGAPGAHRDSRIGSWRWWLVGSVALRLILVATEPSDDSYRYVWEGRVQLAGANPFLTPPEDPRLEHLRDADFHQINHPDYTAIYPPVAQLEFLAAAALHPSVYTVKLIHVVWDVLTVVVLGFCLRRLGRAPHGAMIYALCPLVLSAFAIDGHVDSLMLLLLALCLLAVLSGRTLLSGAALGAAIATKLVPMVLIPWFLLRHPRALLPAAAVVVVGYALYLDAGLSLFDSLFRFSGEGEFFSLGGAFGLASFQTPIQRTAALLCMGFLLLVLARRRTDLTDYAPASFATMLCLMPVVHYWYVTCVLMFLPFGLRFRWLAASLAFVVYFEAEFARNATGEWIMPTWAPVIVWTVFLITWLVEALFTRRALAACAR